MNQWLAYLYPQLVETVTSPVNGLIKIYYYWHHYSLVAGNLTQSGGLVVGLWSKVVSHLLSQQPDFHPRSALILGYGGGSLGYLLSQTYPGIKLTGVDLDPVMFELGKKYLQTPNEVEMRYMDASAYLEKYKKSYDLICLDAFLGNKIQQHLLMNKFINQIKNHLHPQGVAIFNIMAVTSQRLQAQKFISRLSQSFSHHYRLPTQTNWIILAY